MSRVYDDERLAGAYERGNDMPEASLRAWVGQIASYVQRPSPSIVEIGAGTVCSPSRWPAGSTAPRFWPWILPGRCSPRPDAITRILLCGICRGRLSCARPCGCLRHGLSLPRDPPRPQPRPGSPRTGPCPAPRWKGDHRTTFRERLDAVVYDYWPQLRTIDDQRFPGEEEVVADFVAAGFGLEDVTSFAQPVTASLADYHARLVTRPQSKFTYLTTEQFRQGHGLMGAAAHKESLDKPRPVLERYDLAVFSRL